MGLFGTSSDKHLERAMKELEKYEQKTNTDVTVVVEERNQEVRQKQNPVSEMQHSKIDGSRSNH